jgi:hypothetical protein
MSRQPIFEHLGQLGFAQSARAFVNYEACSAQRWRISTAGTAAGGQHQIGVANSLCRQQLMSPTSYVANSLCRQQLMSPTAYVAKAAESSIKSLEAMRTTGTIP